MTIQYQYANPWPIHQHNANLGTNHPSTYLRPISQTMTKPWAICQSLANQTNQCLYSENLTSVQDWSSNPFPIPNLDHNDGQFFRAMEWLMFFFRPPLTSMVFQWFWYCWTITIECFWRAQPLVSMVFQWFLKFWGQWSTMVWHVPSHKRVRKINSRQNANSQH